MNRIRNAEDAMEHLKRESAVMCGEKWRIWDGQNGHLADNQDAEMLNTTNLVLIRKRLVEYKKHKNDPYIYDRREIEAVRELEGNAEEHIRFLLYILDKNKAAR